ncbi:MAG: O-antigen ligase family protein [Burkholderiales bacterium]|jgi:O-antigen ligase|nr:O-antigen ligase family protein [Burkholderiales bacterium]
MKHSGSPKEGTTKTLWVEWIVYGLSLTVLLLAIPFPAEARKIFYFTCGLAGIGWALDRRRPDNGVLFLLAALAFFALYRGIHTIIEIKTFLPETNASQVYLWTASRFLMGLLLIGYLSTRCPSFHERWFRIVSATLMLSLVVAVGNELILGEGRIERTRWATILAYEVVAVCFAYIGLQLTRQINERKHWGALTCVSLLALGIVLWTGTRTALLCFFIGGALLLVLSERARKWKVLGAASLLMAVVLVGSYPYLVKPRLMEAYTDITQYVSGENRATSLGTRFELWRGSVMALKQTPLWGGGYQKRSDVLSDAIEQHHLDSVALHYGNKVHMHNDLLEELSLRGLIGGALLLLVYSAVAVLGWRARPKNLALLGVLFVYVFSGLTDALFFNRETTMLFIMLLAVLIRSSPRQGET